MLKATLVITDEAVSVSYVNADSVTLSITHGASLWEADGVDKIKPKGGKKVNAEWIELDTVTENNYTDEDKAKVDKLVTTGDGAKFLGDDGAYQTIDTSDKQDVLVSGTNIKTVNSTTLLGSGDVAVQETLVSGTNIKSINGESIMGSGDMTVSTPPKSGTGTITTTGWASNTGDYTYKLDLAITGIEDSDVIMISINPDVMDIATTAQLCPTIDSYDGGITLYAKTVPTATIGFSYCSIVVTSQTGGDFTKGVCFYVDGTLYTDTKLMTVISPISMTVIGVRMSVDTAPTGADLIVDVNKNGTTMYTTQANRPTITAGETTETATLPDVISIGVGDRISIDIDQAGSSVSGSNLAITIICEV